MTDPMTPAALAEIAARAAETRFDNNRSSDIPRLLAEVERLAAENARLRDAERIAWALVRGVMALSSVHGRISPFKARRDYYPFLAEHQHDLILYHIKTGASGDAIVASQMKSTGLTVHLTPEARAAIDAAKEST